MTALLIEHLGAAIAALTAHWGYFNNGEHDLEAPTIAKAHFALAFCIASAKVYLGEATWSAATYATSLVATTYVVVLMLSIVIYRIFLSPLRRFPGRLSWAVSKLTHVAYQTRADNYLVLEKQRREFGDFVRTGPNEITIFTVEAMQQIYGGSSKCTRGAYYDLLQPMESLDTTRDPAMHARRRKIWDQFFSLGSLKRQEEIIYEYGDRLVQAVERHLGEALDMSLWSEYYTFDLMGRFGLGVDFGLLLGKAHDIHKLYHSAHSALGPMAAAPWIKHLMMAIPYIERLRSYRLFLTWSTRLLEDKIESNQEVHDVLGYVIDDARKLGTVRTEWRFLMGDLALVIAAGSDPMRLTITNIFYYLITQPEYLRQVREELARLDVRDYKALASAQMLTAVIYETVRLHPAVPAACLRITPPEGLRLDDTFIPGGTTVVVPQYSLHRDARNFVQPDCFIPERFTSRPELILDKEAYYPWSLGKGQCIGKNLSLIEIRVAIALLVDRFDIEFAPEEDGSRVFKETMDYFTMTPGPLHVVFSRRQA